MPDHHVLNVTRFGENKLLVLWCHGSGYGRCGLVVRKTGASQGTDSLTVAVRLRAWNSLARAGGASFDIVGVQGCWAGLLGRL